METIVIEDLETGQQAQHETGLEEQPPPEEAEEDAAMHEAVLQASYRTKKRPETHQEPHRAYQSKKTEGPLAGTSTAWGQLEWHKRAPVPVENPPGPAPVENQVSPYHGARINPAIGTSPSGSNTNAERSGAEVGGTAEDPWRS